MDVLIDKVLSQLKRIILSSAHNEFLSGNYQSEPLSRLTQPTGPDDPLRKKKTWIEKLLKADLTAWDRESNWSLHSHAFWMGCRSITNAKKEASKPLNLDLLEKIVPTRT